MKKGWMIRAGEGGRFAESFKDQNCVAIGWNGLGDLNRYPSSDAIRNSYIDQWGNAKPSRTANVVAIARKFRDDIQSGHMVITYSPELRVYHIGEDQGEYQYRNDDNLVGEYAHVRMVKWLGDVSRDALSQATRNSLGSTLTMFSLSDSVISELLAVLNGEQSMQQEDADSEETLVQLKDQTIDQSHELIKDKIQSLLPDEMEHLAAALLRGMGYRTRVSPKGPDRGVDVFASPDGLGLTQPRIKVEVKHRQGNMGSQAIRSFLGALRDGDSGLFVSTGGFSREARYEAERATVPVTLIDIDDLASLIVTHYEQFDVEGKTLLPLVKIYWPAD
ncbi:restriction endonuclease [Kistimonas asteriae]|uniref:restriction endonuclease n=1 Tax=Kistimonas asteriae TaxID=517724 RepID=UPI001BA583B6|nr:restriction endonuclease [Kistimonas asteriae]